MKLGKHYCMKEFFMKGINVRQGNIVTVSVEDNRSDFELMRTKFLKEAQRMAFIENPHVAEVYDFFEENATAYYVMRLINGQSLSDAMKKRGRPYNEDEVATLLPQMLSALRCVHQRSIYHLDLKPANIMINEEGHLWLIDFGASKQISSSESVTLSSSSGLCYTLGYAPSELISGSTRYIGAWTDFYSLGATLYNLLTNERPPEVEDVKYKGERAFHFPKATSRSMRRLILWLMNPDYPQRPQKVADIESWLSSQPVQAGEEVEAGDITRRAKKVEKKQPKRQGKKHLGIIIAAIFIFVAFFLTLLLWPKGKPAVAPAIEDEEVEDVEAPAIEDEEDEAEEIAEETEDSYNAAENHYVIEQTVREEHDLKFLKKNDVWCEDSIQSDKYKDLYYALERGDIYSLLDHEYSQLPDGDNNLNGWWQTIRNDIQKLQAEGNEAALTKCSNEMIRLSRSRSCNIHELAASIKGIAYPVSRNRNSGVNNRQHPVSSNRQRQGAEMAGDRPVTYE